MTCYRIVFVKNKILSCSETREYVNDTPYYEYHNGQLSFIIVKADSESQARSKAKYVALELKQKQQQ
jgi:hypothetical protein